MLELLLKLQKAKQSKIIDSRCCALQAMSFYSWNDIPHAEILKAINSHPSGALRAWHVEDRPRTFHATFAATWRRYIYLFPLKDEPTGTAPCRSGEDHASNFAGTSVAAGGNDDGQTRYSTGRKTVDLTLGGETAAAAGIDQDAIGREQGLGQPSEAGTASGASDAYSKQHNSGTDYSVVDAVDVDPVRVQEMLQRLSGRTLDCHAFARDTPKGKDCVCTIHLARATVVRLPSASSHAQGNPEDVSGDASVCDTQRQHPEGISQLQQPHAAHSRAICIELIADRFLRRMVRVVVSTALREASDDAGRCSCSPDALLQLAEAGDRWHTASPAPAVGLLFAGVGYDGREPSV